jgi:hypothetical protein
MTNVRFDGASVTWQPISTIPGKYSVAPQAILKKNTLKVRFDPEAIKNN